MDLSDWYDVGGRIRLYRKRAGVTQYELGRMVERPSQIPQFERGDALPSPGVLKDISRVLGVSFAELTGTDVETYRKTFPRYRGWVDDALAEGDWTGMTRREVCTAIGTVIQNVNAAVDRLEKRGVHLEFAPEPSVTKKGTPRLATGKAQTKKAPVEKHTGRRCAGCRFSGETSGMHYCSLYLEEGRSKQWQEDGSCSEYITKAQWKKEKKAGLR